MATLFKYSFQYFSLNKKKNAAYTCLYEMIQTSIPEHIFYWTLGDRYAKIITKALSILICLNIGTPEVINFPSGTNAKLWFEVSQYLNNLGYVFHYMEFLLRSCSGKEENFHLKIFSSLEFLSYLSCLRLYS